MENQDDEAVNHNDYKGIYYAQANDDKYIDPLTGAHFEYCDMYNRLKIVQS